MKILYAIQGTGNGHISRAREIIPLLRKRCETDILVSGYQADLELPFEVNYRMHGLSFIFGKNGGIDYRKTYKKANTKKLISEIKALPVKDYDFVINDFEPVSAWACYINRVPCIALSHQASLLDKNVPKPGTRDSLGNFILKNYAPASVYFSLHFSRYSKNIFTPVIRKEVRNMEKSDNGHYLVYLPAYEDKEVVRILDRIPEVKWHIFSRECQVKITVNNITIYPVDHNSFLKSLLSCTGVLCGAGFETPAEALYLGKKLMVVPMKNQVEQHYNAAALKSMGISVLKKVRFTKVARIKEWVENDLKIEITYPDITEQIINRIFELYVSGNIPKGKWSDKFILSPLKKVNDFITKL
jgi:uncharacterized protein (TIGR00661 family)